MHSPGPELPATVCAVLFGEVRAHDWWLGSCNDLLLKGTVPDLADATVTVSCSDEMLKSETQWQANRCANLKHLLFFADKTP